MAKIRNNLIVRGVSGMLGKQVVMRRQKNGKYVLAAAPDHTSHNLSDAQKQQQTRFRLAVLYAKGAAKNTPEYQNLAESRGQSTFNVAVADFLHPPEIQNIDVSAYTGAAGQSITITAVDDVKVKTVSVSIANDDGTVVEKGSAVVSAQNPDQWLYTTSAAASSASVKVSVDAADLAGQITEETQIVTKAAA